MRRAALTATLACLTSLLAVTAAVAPAAAQPTLTAPLDAPPPARRVPRKSPGAAVAVSSIATIMSGALIATLSPASLLGVAGLVVAPSAGHWYAGGGNRKGILLRGAAATVFGLAFLRGISIDGRECWVSGPADSANCAAQEAEWRREENILEGIALGGLAVLVGSALYDTVTAGNAARRWNHAHALTVAPLVTPSTSGVVVAGRF